MWTTIGRMPRTIIRSEPLPAAKNGQEPPHSKHGQRTMRPGSSACFQDKTKKPLRVLSPSLFPGRTGRYRVSSDLLSCG